MFGTFVDLSHTIQHMFRQWVNVLVTWFLCCIRRTCISLFRVHSSNEVNRFDTFRCNRKIESRAWRIPELCKYLYEKYGKLVYLRLLGQRVLIVTDFTVANALMTNHGHCMKERFGNQYGLQKLNMYRTGLIWNNNVQQWKQNRNVFESTLKMGSKNLEALALGHLETVERTTLKLAEPVTLLELLRNFTLTMTMEGLFEIQMPNAYAWREEAKRTVADYFKAWEFFLLNPNSSNLTDDNEVHRSSCSKMLQLSQEIFAKSEEGGSSHFISKLSHFNDSNGVLQCIAEMLLAGTDTSSITMFYTLLFLADCPEIGNKVSHIIHSESQEAIDKEISYLYYESMRLIPVGPVILRQCENGIDHGGEVSLRKGDGIIFNIAGMNRTSYDQSEQFNPYRYETDEYFPLSFGVGKKSCVGKNFAEKEMKLFFTWFLKKYNVLGHRADMVSLLKTRWDVANAPVQDIKLTIFPRKLIYFVGDHGTGKSVVLDAFQAAYPLIKIIRKEQILTNRHQHNECADLQLALLNAHSQMLNSIKSQLALIESSIVDCLISLKGNVLMSGYPNEIELMLRPMKNCLLVHFPNIEQNQPGKLHKNQDYLDLMRRIGGRCHSLKMRSASDRYEEILSFIATCPS